MLREGHPPPEIDEAAGDVSVRLSGGRPDPVILDLYDRIFSRDPALQDDVRTPIAMSLLLAETLSARSGWPGSPSARRRRRSRRSMHWSRPVSSLA